MSRSFKFRYVRDGVDSEGEYIPDIPVIYIYIEGPRGRAWGPAVVDTGFDGGIYPNIEIIKILRGSKPDKVKLIESPLAEPVTCEIYTVKMGLIEANTRKISQLREAKVYVPTEPEYISDEVLIGREILNNYKIILNGETVTIL